MGLPCGQPAFTERFTEPLRAEGIDVFQINVGYRCNLECRHCHVQAGPLRAEVMSKTVMEQCLTILESHSIATVDITGGSPEMHPHLRWFLRKCSTLNRRTLVRTNAVILLEPAYKSFMDLYAENGIEVIVSLPHTDPGATDRQRGSGVFLKVIEAIKLLNAKGYGKELVLDIVCNPTGAYLPGAQAALEANFREVLLRRYGISFTHLFCITNMPIGRYLTYLRDTGNHGPYMNALAKAFNPAALDKVMCKTTLSLSWDGRLYDCDFNQVLNLGLDGTVPDHISAFNLAALANRKIAVGNHCYGCTAGAGSSCRGIII